MNKRLAGLICGIISMASVVVFLIWGFLLDDFGHAWLVFVFGGVASAIISMIANYQQAKKEEESEEK